MFLNYSYIPYAFKKIKAAFKNVCVYKRNILNKFQFLTFYDCSHDS